ncbi:MAG: MFS transporter, partial [Candidatus Sulfotelmatobacter sp.]
MEGISWRQLTIAERAVQSAGMEIGPIRLIREATRDQRRTLLAAALGWALDAFDAMLYALVLALLIRDFGMSKTTAGFLGTLTLLASGLGGVMFGFLADRMGRKRALMASILTYSVCSFASGLATSIAMLATARFVLGLGMGGEWNTGATLVAETWPTELRAKAIAIVQSSWAIGFAVAALVAGPVARYFGWRAVFFVGILPAVLTLWMRRGVPESKIWEERKILRSETQSANGPQTADIKRDGLSDSRVSALTVITERKDSTSFWMIFRSPYLKSTVALLLFNLFCMFAWWGLFTWIPPYLSLPVSQGGRGFG